MVKNPPANTWAIGEPGLIPGSGRCPRGWTWLLTPVFLPGKYHGQRSLMGYSPYDQRIGYDWTTERARTHTYFEQVSVPFLINLGQDSPLKHLQGPGFSVKNMTTEMGGRCSKPSTEFFYEIAYLRRDPSGGNHKWAALSFIFCSATLAQHNTAGIPALEKNLDTRKGNVQRCRHEISSRGGWARTNLQKPGGQAPSFKPPSG